LKIRREKKVKRKGGGTIGGGWRGGEGGERTGRCARSN